MPQAPIPFVPDQQSGWSMRASGSPMAVNVVIDGRGAVRRRPGITAYENYPTNAELGTPVILGNVGGTPIVGLWVTLKDELYAVDSQTTRHIYLITKTGGSPPPSPTFKDLSVDGSGAVIFAKTLLGKDRKSVV